MAINMDILNALCGTADNEKSPGYSIGLEVTHMTPTMQLLKEAVEQASLSVGAYRGGIGVHLIPKSASGALAASHASDYVKGQQRTDQSAFIKESLWWVPTEGGNSSSLLDKLFYRVY
jgi:hypothetical protein